jgi:methyl-accepting chemotaxis protein
MSDEASHLTGEHQQPVGRHRLAALGTRLRARTPSMTSLRARLYLTLTVVVALTAALGGFALLQLSHVRSSMRDVEAHLPGVVALAAINSSRSELRTIDAEHIAAYSADDKAAVERRMDASLGQISAAMADYEPRISSEREKAIYAQFLQLWADFVVERQLMLALSRDNRTPEARAQFSAGAAGFDAASASLRDLIALNRSSAQGALARGESLYQSARLWVALAIIAVVVIAAALGVAMVTRVGRALARVCFDIRDGAQRLETLSGEVAESARTLADGATQQATTVDQTASTVEEITAMTRTNAGHAREASQLMAESAVRVNASNEVLAGMVAAMTSIRTSSERVANIAKTIDGIAFQTNILALNAAVEAARAGEAGRGFAVVANEVRNLAQRSAASARDAAELIDEAIKSTAEGSRRVDSVVGTIQGITSNLASVRQIIDAVSDAGDQQATACNRLLQGSTTVGAVTQRTAAAAHESAAASQTLRQHAGETLATLAELERVIGGATAAPATAPGRSLRRTPSRRERSYQAEAA